MEERMLFNKVFLLITYVMENDLILLRWKRFAKTEEFLEGLNTALKYVIDLKIERVLAYHFHCAGFAYALPLGCF
jgi:hypothetical protein